MWFELHQARQRHPKIFRLARELRSSPKPDLDRRYACGLLDDFWSWALDVVKVDGRLEGLSSEDIASVLGFSMDFGEQLMDALVSSGFVDLEKDGTYRLHDWGDYAGKLIEKREKDAARKQAERRKSTGSPQDVRGMSARTEPNNTLPNNTLPDNTEHAVAVHDEEDEDDTSGNLPQSAADCGNLRPSRARAEEKLREEKLSNYHYHKDNNEIGIPLDCNIGGEDTKVDIVTYARQNLMRFNDGDCIADLKDFLEQGVEEDAIRYAIDQAVKQGKVSWSYVQVIVNRLIARGIKTASEARAAEKQYQAAKAKGGTKGAGYQSDRGAANAVDQGCYDAAEIERISKLFSAGSS